MQPENATSQEMLDQLLAEGRISEDDFVRLSRAMQNRTKAPNADMTVPPAGRRRGVPWQAWTAIALMGICCLGASLAIVQNPPLSIGCISMNAFMMLGLYYKNKWVYAFATFISLCSIMIIGHNPLGAVIGFVTGIILLTARREFFRPQATSCIR